jgi:Holliday junction DNA helicase RuvA
VIERIRGLLLEKHPTRALVEAGGIGYAVQVSLATFRRLPEPGAEVRLFTHYHVREDAHALFGFSSVEERTVFEMLLDVSGIGPRIALGILSGPEPGAFRKAILARDLAFLTSIPGIGRKTAERLVVELRDRMQTLDLSALEEGAETPKAPAASPEFQDAVEALVALGYTRPPSVRAVRSVMDTAEGPVPVEDVVRRALALIASR